MHLRPWTTSSRRPPRPRSGSRAPTRHAYLVAKDEHGADVVTHQCLVWSTGRIVRQYERRRRLLHGPCQKRSTRARPTTSTTRARTVSTGKLLAELRAREKALKTDPARLEYVKQYRAFLEPAKTLHRVPDQAPRRSERRMRRALLDGPRGLLRRPQEADHRGVHRRLRGRAHRRAHRQGEGRREHGGAPRVFDDAEASPWDGTGPYLERILRHHLRHGSWNRAEAEIEKFVMSLALRESKGQPDARPQAPPHAAEDVLREAQEVRTGGTPVSDTETPELFPGVYPEDGVPRIEGLAAPRGRLRHGDHSPRRPARRHALHDRRGGARLRDHGPRERRLPRDPPGGVLRLRALGPHSRSSAASSSGARRRRASSRRPGSARRRAT